MIEGQLWKVGGRIAVFTTDGFKDRGSMTAVGIMTTGEKSLGRWQQGQRLQYGLAFSDLPADITLLDGGLGGVGLAGRGGVQQQTDACERVERPVIGDAMEVEAFELPEVSRCQLDGSLSDHARHLAKLLETPLRKEASRGINPSPELVKPSLSSCRQLAAYEVSQVGCEGDLTIGHCAEHEKRRSALPGHERHGASARCPR